VAPKRLPRERFSPSLRSGRGACQANRLHWVYNANSKIPAAKIRPQLTGRSAAWQAGWQRRAWHRSVKPAPGRKGP